MSSDERIQLNVTLRKSTIDKLKEQFPTALEDSERIRQAVAESLERGNATEYTIRR
jgi:hypothetical protein